MRACTYDIIINWNNLGYHSSLYRFLLGFFLVQYISGFWLEVILLVGIVSEITFLIWALELWHLEISMRV